MNRRMLEPWGPLELSGPMPSLQMGNWGPDWATHLRLCMFKWQSWSSIVLWTLRVSFVFLLCLCSSYSHPREKTWSTECTSCMPVLETAPDSQCDHQPLIFTKKLIFKAVFSFNERNQRQHTEKLSGSSLCFQAIPGHTVTIMDKCGKIWWMGHHKTSASYSLSACKAGVLEAKMLTPSESESTH